jgi:arginyl-tRNA synthetase
MILPIHAAIRARLQETLVSAFGIAPDDLPSISLEVPPKRALGDVAVPVAFELARRLK